MFELGICKESQIMQDGDDSLLNEVEKAQIYEWAMEISLHEPESAPSNVVEPLTVRVCGRPGPVTQYLGKLAQTNPAAIRAHRIRRAIQLEVTRTHSKVEFGN